MSKMQNMAPRSEYARDFYDVYYGSGPEGLTAGIYNLVPHQLKTTNNVGSLPGGQLMTPSEGGGGS